MLGEQAGVPLAARIAQADAERQGAAGRVQLTLRALPGEQMPTSQLRRLSISAAANGLLAVRTVERAAELHRAGRRESAVRPGRVFGVRHVPRGDRIGA